MLVLAITVKFKEGYFLVTLELQGVLNNLIDVIPAKAGIQEIPSMARFLLEFVSKWVRG